jgi:hypothetical protein
MHRIVENQAKVRLNICMKWVQIHRQRTIELRYVGLLFKPAAL